MKKITFKRSSGVTRIEESADNIGVLVDLFDVLMWATYPIFVICTSFSRYDFPYAIVRGINAFQSWAYYTSWLIFLPAVLLILIRPLRIIGLQAIRATGRLSLFAGLFSSASIAYMTVGSGGMILGSLFGGYGVVVAAVIGSKIRHTMTSEVDVVFTVFAGALISFIVYLLGSMANTRVQKRLDAEAI